MRFCLSLVLAISLHALGAVSGQAIAEPDGSKSQFVEEIGRAYAAEDYTELDRLFTRPAWDRTKDLSAEELNRLARLVADHLQFGPIPAAYKPGYMPGEDWSAFIRANQSDRGLVRRNGINDLSIQKLRSMALAGQISDPALIPPLIDAFQHPGSNVRKYAYHTLEALTGRRFGADVWERGIEDPVKEPKHIEEWRAWWLACREKRPILSKELRDQVLARVVKISQLIGKELGPRFPGELDWLGDKPYIHNRFNGDYRPLVAFRYEPVLRSLLLPLGRKHLPPEALPFLLVEADFKTMATDRKPDTNYYIGLKKESLRTVHEETVAGTDLRIAVHLDSPNQDLARAIGELLKNK